MKLLPPPGPERRRLMLLMGALVVLGALYMKYGPTTETPVPTATGSAPSSVKLAGLQKPGASPPVSTQAARPTAPVALKLRELDERVPDEPKAGRNLFRFGTRPVPPPPPAPPLPPYEPPPPAPPPPPVIPPIPLKLTVIIEDPYEPGRRRAYLTDTRTGASFEGLQGQIIDGRYKLIVVGENDVVMSHLDGSGRRTIRLGG